MTAIYYYNVSDFINATNINIGDVADYLNNNVNMIIKVAHILKTDDIISIYFYANIDGTQLNHLNILIAAYKYYSELDSKFNYVESSILHITTSKTYINAITITSDLIAGLYKINFTYDISQSSSSNTTYTRITVDDIQESENAHAFIRSRQLTKFTGFIYKTLTDGSHTVNLDYKASSGESSITNIILDICLVV